MSSANIPNMPVDPVFPPIFQILMHDHPVPEKFFLVQVSAVGVGLVVALFGKVLREYFLVNGAGAEIQEELNPVARFRPFMR